jgi:hypothetical protein
VTIRFHRQVFRAIGDDLDDWSQDIVVECDNPEAALEGLQRAAERVVRVGRGGAEYSDSELDALQDRVDTANYSAATWSADGLPALYVDCKSDIGSRRSAAFRRIVRDELTNAGIAAAIVRPSDSRPGSLDSPAEEADPPEPWVRFQDCSPTGYPAALVPADVNIVHSEADIVYGGSHGGESYSGWWQAMVYCVDDAEPEQLVERVVPQLRSAGCVSRSTPRSPEPILPMLFVPLSFQGMHVDVVALHLQGARGKPSYLRRRPETSCLWISVTQPDPDSPFD